MTSRGRLPTPLLGGDGDGLFERAVGHLVAVEEEEPVHFGHAGGGGVGVFHFEIESEAEGQGTGGVGAFEIEEVHGADLGGIAGAEGDAGESGVFHGGQPELAFGEVIHFVELRQEGAAGEGPQRKEERSPKGHMLGGKKFHGLDS